MRESWTGYQVAWKMARGYSGAFGHKLNAPYVFLPLCAIFLLGLVDWRRLLAGRQPRPARPARLRRLPLLLQPGRDRRLGAAPVPGRSLYLLGRALWIGFRGRGEGLRPVWPAAWLLVAALFLMGFRVGLNIADSGAIDVGYAERRRRRPDRPRRTDLRQLPRRRLPGRHLRPGQLLAYVPFERIWPWSGSWDDLPAAHGAAVIFDLATFALLILLGLRIRPGPAGRRSPRPSPSAGPPTPTPPSPCESNSNDTLVAMLLVATLLVLARPVARGALAALATFAKFAPALLAPMLADLRADEPSAAAALLFAAGLRRVVGVAASMLWPAIDPGLHTFYDRTIAYQAGRDSPFSIWGQVACAGTAAHRDPRRGRGARRSLFAFRPTAQDAAPGGGAGRGPADRAAADHAPLVLPLHRLVLPAAAGRDGGGCRAEDLRSPDGAGTITCSIESASPCSLTSTTAPITQTSSSAVSNRAGIWVISDASACSGLTPSTLVREPVMPTSEMKAVPLRQHPAVGGRHVGVGAEARRRRGRRGASPSPPSRWSPRRGSRRSTQSASIRSRMRRPRGRASGRPCRPTAPLRLITADPHPAGLDHGVAAAGVGVRVVGRPHHALARGRGSS